MDCSTGRRRPTPFRPVSSGPSERSRSQGEAESGSFGTASGTTAVSARRSTTSLYDSVTAGTTAYVDSSAGPGVTYTYWVTAVDSIQETFGAGEGALSAHNLGVPVGDFSSDTKVGLDDFTLFVDAYGIDSTDVEFDPLFDLDGQGDIYTSRSPTSS